MILATRESKAAVGSIISQAMSLKRWALMIIVKELEDSVLDKDPQAAGRGQGLVFRAVQGIFLQGPPVGVFQDGGIESFFIAKVVIDRGEVGPGPAADFPDGGLAEAAGGKDFTGGQQEALPGFRSGGGRRFQFSVFGFQFRSKVLAWN